MYDMYRSRHPYHQLGIGKFRCSNIGVVVEEKHLPLLLFFFFQAEDGIRDLTVTGVQTCALPISVGAERVALAGEHPGRVLAVALEREHPGGEREPAGEVLLPQEPQQLPVVPVARSEERRVGKECRGGWSWYR